MSLSLDAFKEASRPKRLRCGVETVRQALEKKDRDALDAAVSDVCITSAAIETVLKAAGHDVRQQTISRHRKGGCSCSVAS